MKEKLELNVLFVVIDATRPENLGCYGHHQNISPNIDEIAKRGVLFEDAYCGINCTEPSLTSIFSGRYPISTGFYKHGERIQKSDIQKLDNIKFLPEILNSMSYKTMAVDWLDRWHSRGYDYYSGGFKGQTRWFIKRHMEKLPKVLNRLIFTLAKQKSATMDNASIVTNKALKLIENNDYKNFFLFLHYWDTHTPYRPPKQYIKYVEENYVYDSTLEDIDTLIKRNDNPVWRKYFDFVLDGAKDLNEVILRYLGSIAYVDHEIGKLIGKLEELQILEDTLIIITSDHGESLTEHGIYFSHHGLYDETIHIPLILSCPNKLPENKTVKGFVQHVDLVPTILNILNLDLAENNDFNGYSLLPLIFGEKNQLRSSIVVEEEYTERKSAIRTENYKYIYSPSIKEATCRYCGIIHGGVEELYDLKKDPHETENIIHEKADVANNLRKQLFDWMKHFKEKKERENIKLRIKELKSLNKV